MLQAEIDGGTSHCHAAECAEQVQSLRQPAAGIKTTQRAADNSDEDCGFSKKSSR
jgi:hypothetical protein